jgi:hypothetical protein
MERQPYSTDLTDAQYALLEPFFPKVGRVSGRIGSLPDSARHVSAKRFDRGGIAPRHDISFRAARNREKARVTNRPVLAMPLYAVRPKALLQDSQRAGEHRIAWQQSRFKRCEGSGTRL